MTIHSSHKPPLPASKCPSCRYETNCSSVIYAPAPCTPKPGDTSICLNCGQLRTYQADLTLRKISPEEIKGLMEDSDAWAATEKARELVRQRGRFA